MSNLLKRVLSMAVALIMVFSLIPVTSLAADSSATFTASAQGYENAEDFTSWTDGTVTISADKGKGTNPPKYYTSGSAVRLYGNNTLAISVAEGNVIESVVITTVSNYALTSSNTGITNATLSNSGTTTTLKASADATSIGLTNTSSGQWRITSIVVNYSAVSASACTHTNTTDTTVAAGCNTEGSVTTICKDCGKTVNIETIPATGHTYDGEGGCEGCDAVAYYLVTDASQLAEGAKVIITAAESELALSTTQNDNNRAQANITKSDDVALFGDDTQVLTLEKDADTGMWAFNTGNGYLYAASSGSNHLKTQETNNANGLWAITIADNVASIVATSSSNRNVMQHNATSSIFSCYSGTSQKALALYADKLAAGCKHANTTTEITKATCTEDGKTVVTCEDCGNVVNTTTIAAEGHSYVIGEAITCKNCDLSAALTSLTDAATIATEAGADYTADVYYVTGVIESIANADYGNMTIADADGSTLYIYGVYGADGSYFDKLESAPVVGDTVILAGVLGTYNDTPQMKNATLVSFSTPCAHTGEKEYQDNYDGETHEVTCADCGEVITKEEPHEYENGVCACGVEEPAALGSQGNPIQLGEMGDTDLAWNEDHTEATYSVTVPEGETYYFVLAPMCCGMEMTDNGGEATVMNQNHMLGCNFTLAAGEHNLVFTYPLGSDINPEEVYPNDYYDAEVVEGSNGYYYVYNAEATGTIDLWIYELTDVTEADLVVTNGSAQRTLAVDGVADMWGDLILSVEVEAGDEVIIQAITVDPEIPWNTPAGTVGWTFNFSYPLGSQNNPIQLGEMGDSDLVWNEDYSEATYSVTVPEGETYYLALAANRCGMLMSDNGGEAVVMNQNHMMGCNFTLAAGEHELVFTYPLGSDSNPDTLLIGDNSCAPNYGYYTYRWIATGDGKLTITMAGDVWEYGITNNTASIGTDTHYSSDETVVASETIAVSKGDEIIVVVSGGEELTFNAAFKATAVAKIGETEYATVSEALAAAKSGETVALTADAEENYVIVTPGVTLDLGAHTLTANYVIGLQDSCITGTTISADGQTGAKLKVAKNNVSLAAKIAMSGNYAILPVWNGDHYVFSLFYASAPEQITVSNEGDKVSLSFKHQASNYVQECLKNGSSAYGVSVIVRAEWTIDGANLSQEFVYTDTMVGNVSKDNKMAYSAEMSGCTSKEDLTISIMIVTDAGATYLAKTYSEIN